MSFVHFVSSYSILKKDFRLKYSSPYNSLFFVTYLFSYCVRTYFIIFAITGGRCEEGEKCDQILSGFENIDDELDESGIVFVTTEDQNIAKEYNIKNFPALVFFRNKEPLYYSGK